MQRSSDQLARQDTSSLHQQPVEPTVIGKAIRAETSRSSRRTPSLAKALTCLTFVAIFFAIARPLTFSPVSWDEQYFMWCGWMLNKGFMPYRDFIEIKPPMAFVVNAVSLKIFGLDDGWYRLGPTISLGTSLLMFLLAMIKRFGSITLAIAIAFAATTLIGSPSAHDTSFNDTESIGFAFMIAGYTFMLWPTTMPRLFNFLGGCAFSLAILSKEPYILTAVPALLTFALLNRFHQYSTIVGLTSPRSDTTAAAKQSLFYQTLLFGIYGMTIPLALFAAWLTIGHAWTGYLDTLATALRYASKDGLGGVIRGNVVLEALQVLSRLSTVFDVRYLAPVSLTPLYASWLASIFTRSFRLLGITAACGCAAGLYAVTLGGNFFAHYYILAFPGLLLPGIAGASVMSKKLAVADRFSELYTNVLLWMCVAAGTLPAVCNGFVAPTKFLPPYSQQLIRYIQQRVPPNEYIATLDSPAIYIYADRLGPFRRPVFVPELLDCYAGRNDEERLNPERYELNLHQPIFVFYPPRDHPAKLFQRQERFRKALLNPYFKSHQYEEISDGVFERVH